MINSTMFGVHLCQCDEPYDEWPVDGIVFCETCHGVVRYEEPEEERHERNETREGYTSFRL